MALDFLYRGTPGHPLHPPLTDATIGTYAFATVAAVLSKVGVAESDAGVVGFAILSSDELMQIHVAPGEQNAGIGSALLARAKERRPKGFSLWTFQKNVGARRFYERYGFEPEGTYAFMVGNHADEDIVMRLKL